MLNYTGNHVADGGSDDYKESESIEPNDEAKKAFEMLKKMIASHYSDRSSKLITHTHINFNEKGDIVIEAPFLTGYMTQKLLSVCEIFTAEFAVHAKNNHIEIQLRNF